MVQRRRCDISPPGRSCNAILEKITPPTCTYLECSGKTFTAQKGLRAHLRIHEDQQREQALQIADVGEEDQKVAKRARRGGEMGRDWACARDGCGQAFKSVRISLHLYRTARLVLIVLLRRFRKRRWTITKMSRTLVLVPLPAQGQTAGCDSVTNTSSSGTSLENTPLILLLRPNPPTMTSRAFWNSSLANTMPNPPESREILQEPCPARGLVSDTLLVNGL